MPSAVTREVVEDRLQKFAQENNVKVLHAVESGSRGWGFPSIDSDWDCRFIFVRRRQDYLSVKEFPETLSYKDTEFGGDLDMEWWDLRKVLRLAIIGNAVVHEWVQSPVVYDVCAPGFRERFLEEISRPMFRLSGALHNYVGVARTARTVPTITGGYCFGPSRSSEEQAARAHRDKVKGLSHCTPKKLFYYIRAVLAMKWCMDMRTQPPMDLSSLLSVSTIPLEVVSEIVSLREAKTLLCEKDRPLSVSEVLCQWLMGAEESAVTFYKSLSHKESMALWYDSKEDYKRTDEFFSTFI